MKAAPTTTALEVAPVAVVPAEFGVYGPPASTEPAPTTARDRFLPVQTAGLLPRTAIPPTADVSGAAERRDSPAQPQEPAPAAAPGSAAGGSTRDAGGQDILVQARVTAAADVLVAVLDDKNVLDFPARPYPVPVSPG